MTVFKRVACDMFDEYNVIAQEYGIEEFHSVEEVQTTLEGNLTEDDCARLEQDEMARMALSGFVAGLMTAASITIISEDGITGDGSQTSH